MHWNAYKKVAGMAMVALMGLGMSACSDDPTDPDTTPKPREAELPVVTTGLVAYVAMDGRVIESTGKVDSNAITKVGMTPTTDRTGAVGMAMYFDGVDDYASLPGLDTIQVWPLTWSYWYRSEGVQNGLVWPVGKYLHPGGDGMGVFWESGNLAALYTVNGFGNWCRVDLDGTPPTDLWHHVLVTIDHIDGLIMYIDNVRVDFAGWNGQVAKTRTTEPLRFGIINSTEPTSKPVPFKGAISDFAVYNRVLTEAERTQLYTSTK